VHVYIYIYSTRMRVSTPTARSVTALGCLSSPSSPSSAFSRPGHSRRREVRAEQGRPISRTGFLPDVFGRPTAFARRVSRQPQPSDVRTAKSAPPCTLQHPIPFRCERVVVATRTGGHEYRRGPCAHTGPLAVQSVAVEPAGGGRVRERSAGIPAEKLTRTFARGRPQRVDMGFFKGKTAPFSRIRFPILYRVTIDLLQCMTCVTYTTRVSRLPDDV